MAAQRIAELFQAWQASRWASEVKARLLDKALADALDNRASWPLELLEEYEAIRMATAARYRELVDLLLNEAPR